MATKVGIGFQISASAAGMAQGINAGVVELQKLGLQAKRTSADLSTIKTLQISQAFIGGVRAVVGAFTRFTSGSSAAIDQTAKLNRALGLSFEELQQLKLAADLSGASTEQLAQAFGRAQITIGNAQQGSKTATDALRRLGLSVNELASLSASQQFERIATAIAAIDNPARRSAAAVSVFGRSGVQLLPVFQELASNLQRTESFFGAFRQRLSETDARRIEEINDAFTEVQAAITEVTGLVLSRLNPALLSAAQSIQRFIQGLDIDTVANQVGAALERFAQAGELAARVAGVVLQRPLVAVGVALAFINRQALSAALANIGQSFLAAAAAARTFSVSAGLAAAAATTLKTALRGLAAATGVGLVAVGLSLAAEAALNFVVSSRNIGGEVGQELQQVAAATDNAIAKFKQAGAAAVRFGQQARTALKIPALSAADVTQAALSDAQSAVANLARELGGLANVPPEVLADFSAIVARAQQANEAVFDQRIQLAEVQQQADRFTDQLRQQVELQRENAEAAKRTAEEVRKAAQQARGRTQELAVQGLSGAEQSRIKLNQDLAAIALEQVNAERALAAARQAGDQQAALAAKERLRLVQQAARVAKEQDRERRLDALGINRTLFDAVKSVGQVVRELRQAFDAGRLRPEEFANAIRNLAEEGVKIRREIDAELRRPNEQALRIADIRSGEGISQFLQAQRRDPALDQREQQLGTLREIREILRQNNIRVAELV